MTHQILVKLKFPQTLEKQSALYQEFLNVADSTEIEIKSKGGVSYRGTFAPDRQEKIPLPELNFPVNGSDVLEIKVSILARTRKGTKRPSPVLIGEKKLRAEDLEKGKATLVSVTLHLQGPLFEGF